MFFLFPSISLRWETWIAHISFFADLFICLGVHWTDRRWVRWDLFSDRSGIPKMSDWSKAAPQNIRRAVQSVVKSGCVPLTQNEVTTSEGYNQNGFLVFPRGVLPLKCRNTAVRTSSLAPVPLEPWKIGSAPGSTRRTWSRRPSSRKASRRLWCGFLRRKRNTKAWRQDKMISVLFQEERRICAA